MSQSPSEHGSDRIINEILAERRAAYRSATGWISQSGKRFSCDLVRTSDTIETACSLDGDVHVLTIGARTTRLLLALYTSTAGAFMGHVASGARAQQVAFDLYCGLRFVCDHEFYHAISGHVALLESLYSTSRSPELDAIADDHEHDLRLALEMSADRSAFFHQINDALINDLPQNAFTATLDPIGRTSRAAVAMGAAMATFAALPGRTGGKTDHPAIETRLFMLLGPGLSRALTTSGVGQRDALKIQHSVADWFRTYSKVSAYMAAYDRAFLDQDRIYHETENRRLEMIYLLIAAPLLKPLAYAASATGSQVADMR